MKRILIILSVLVAILLLAFVYLNYRNRTLSPPEEISITHQNTTITVHYSRPSVRNRLIFGEASQNALIPYGEYWRFGANESTEFVVNNTVFIEGAEIKPGRYKIYAIPGKSQFEIAISTDTGTWGYSEPDYNKDVVRFMVTPENLPTVTEQFTIQLQGIDNYIYLKAAFEKIALIIPIEIPKSL